MKKLLSLGLTLLLAVGVRNSPANNQFCLRNVFNCHKTL